MNSKFNNIQKEVEEMKEQQRTSRETLGKFFYDLAKFIFASMALIGGISLIMEEPKVKQAALLLIGLSFTWVMAYIDFRILNKQTARYGFHDIILYHRFYHSNLYSNLVKHQKRQRMAQTTVINRL